MCRSKGSFFHKIANGIRASHQEKRGARTFEHLEDRRVLATIPVTLASDAADPTDQDNGITLREAVAYVNGVVPDADDLAIIDFSNGGFGTNDRIIFNLPVGEDTIELLHGELLISRSVEIMGPGSELLTIDASMSPGNDDAIVGNGSRVFHFRPVDNGPGTAAVANIKWSGLTITGGDTSDKGGGIFIDNGDNGIGFSSRVELDDVVLTENFANQGGALYVESFINGFWLNDDPRPMPNPETSLVVTRSLLQNNREWRMGTPILPVPKHEPSDKR